MLHLGYKDFVTMNYRSLRIRNILEMRKSMGRFKNLDFESWYGYLICKSKYGVKSASKQLYLNVVEDIDAKDVQHLLRYSLFYGHV